MAAAVVWITGLPGSGKTTLAHALRDRIEREGASAVIFDGDDLRATISRDLGFSKEDRDEHVRRVSELARAAAAAGSIAIVALISPYRGARDRARRLISAERRFVEVHLDCPQEELRRRDPKGLYQRAASGELLHLTGVSDPYESPLAPEVRIDTSLVTIATTVDRVLSFLG